MATILFTLPGRLGDNFFHLPVAYQWSLQNSQPVDIAVDPKSAPIISLLEGEDWIEKAFVSEGLPDFNYDENFWWTSTKHWSAYYSNVFHLGFRSHPGRYENLITATHKQSDVVVDEEKLLTEPCLHYPVKTQRKLAIHTESSQRGWRTEQLEKWITLSIITLTEEFDEIWIVAKDPTFHFYSIWLKYPRFYHLEDGGDFRKIAQLLSESVLLSVNSAIWAMSDCIKSPCLMGINFLTGPMVPNPSHSKERIVDSRNPSNITNGLLQLRNECLDL